LSVFELGMIGTLVPFIVRDLKLTHKSMGQSSALDQCHCSYDPFSGSYLLSELGASISVVAVSITLIALAGSAAEIVSGVMADRIGGASGAVKLLVLGFTASAGALMSVAFARSAEVRLILILLPMTASRLLHRGYDSWSAS